MISINSFRILTCALLLLILGSCVSYQNDLPKVLPAHAVITHSQTLELWSLEDIYSSYVPYNLLGANSGITCFIGAFQYTENNSVNCIDGITGRTIWARGLNPGENLLVVPDGVYVERDGGGGGVTKYDLMGNNLWTNYIWGSGILYIYLVDDQLQVSGYPYKLLGLDVANGKEIAQYLKGEEGLISTPADTFLIDSYSKLKSVVLASEQTKWETKIPGGLRSPPVFLEDVIILRSDDEIGSIYAIDRATGDIIWKSIEDNVISNIAYSRSRNRVYYLTRDGKFISADVDSGSESILVGFTSTPFILAGEEDVGGYNVAFDDTTSMLYVILGDSRQLFAFKVK